MAAGVWVAEMNGSTWGAGNMTKLSGQNTSVTARYCTMDSATPGQANPIPIPTAGHTPSYWKNHFLFISGGAVGGDEDNYEFTYISSIRWRCDGTLFNWNSTKASGLVVVLETAESEGYGVLSGNYESGCGWNGASSLGKSGALLANHGQYDASSNAEDYVEGSELMVDNRKITPNDTAKFVYSKILVHQALIGSSALSGNPGEETYTWIWDEVS